MIYSMFLIVAILFGFEKSINRQVAIVSDNKYYRNIKKRRYCFWMGVLLFLISALRADNVGGDVQRYLAHFNNISYYGIPYIWATNPQEPGFYLLAWCISFFTKNGRWLLAVIALIYAWAVSYYIYHYSEDPCLSYVILISFSFFAFSLSGLRQTLALAVVFYAFRYVYEGKFKSYLLCIIIASLFHNSAIFSLPIYFLNKLILTSKKRFFIIPILILIYFLRYQLIIFAQNLFYRDYSIQEKPINTWATLAMYIIIWITFLMVNEDRNSKDSTGVIQIHDNAINIEPVFLTGIVIQSFVPYEPNIFRLAMYYQIYSLIAVPQIIHSPSFDKRSQNYAKLVFLVLMLIMFYKFTFYAANANPYSFFWQVKY